MPICKVKGCSSTRSNPSVTLHQFPKDSRIREQWLKFCGCAEGANLFVCSLHFRTSDYENIFMENARKKLQKSAVPTIRLPSGKSDESFSVLNSASTQPKCQNTNKQSDNPLHVAAMIPRAPQRAPTDPKVRCRVCTKWGVKLVPFVGDDGPSAGTVGPQLPCSLPEAIAAVGGVQVDIDDGLPQYCCVFCIRQIEPAYKLRQLCQDTDRKLREMFPKEASAAETQVGEMVYVKVEEVFDKLDFEPVQIKEEPLEVEVIKEEPLDIPADELNLPNIELIDESYPDQAELILESDPQQIELTDGEEMEMEEDPESDASGDDFIDEESNISGENEEDWYEKVPATGFRCCGCKYTFKTKAKLLAHRDKKHIRRKRTPEQLLAIGCLRVQCDVCYKVIARADLLEKHRARDIFEFRCKACGTSFNRRQRVVRHFRIMHQMNVVGPIICCGCAETFTSSKELAAHSKTVHLPHRPAPDGRKAYECNVCYVSYEKDFLLYRHRLKLTEAGKLFQCAKCSKYFSYLHKLRDHERTHETTRCSMCPETNSCPKALQKHIESHKMPDGKFKCFQCGHCLLTAEGLRSHGIQQHAGERPHVCPHCTEAFALEFQLTIHMKSHLEEKFYQCTNCGATFFNTAMLHRHMTFFHMENQRKNQPAMVVINSSNENRTQHM